VENRRPAWLIVDTGIVDVPPAERILRGNQGVIDSRFDLVSIVDQRRRPSPDVGALIGQRIEVEDIDSGLVPPARRNLIIQKWQACSWIFRFHRVLAEVAIALGDRRYGRADRLAFMLPESFVAGKKEGPVLDNRSTKGPTELVLL